MGGQAQNEHTDRSNGEQKNGGNVHTNTRANEMGREKKSTVDER